MNIGFHGILVDTSGTRDTGQINVLILGEFHDLYRGALTIPLVFFYPGV